MRELRREYCGTTLMYNSRGIKLETGVRYGSPRFVACTHKVYSLHTDNCSRDNSLQNQSIRSVSAPVHTQSTSADGPVSILEGVSDSARSSSHSSFKRHMSTLSSDEEQFVLPNLSYTSSPETLRNAFLSVGIPAIA